MFAQLADLAAIPSCDVLLVPGGVGATKAMARRGLHGRDPPPGAGARYVTSVCTGSLILGAAGLLQGKRAACHWAWRELLRAVRRDRTMPRVWRATAGHDHRRRRHRGHRLRPRVLAELAGTDYAQAIQLALEYAPTPPFDAGRPELAPPGGASARPRAAPSARGQGAGQRPRGGRPPAAALGASRPGSPFPEAQPSLRRRHPSQSDTSPPAGARLLKVSSTLQGKPQHLRAAESEFCRSSTGPASRSMSRPKCVSLPESPSMHQWCGAPRLRVRDVHPLCAAHVPEPSRGPGDYGSPRCPQSGGRAHVPASALAARRSWTASRTRSWLSSALSVRITSG